MILTMSAVISLYAAGFETGIYYLHVKFYDKWGTPYIETLKNQNGEYNLPIYLDRRGPMVFVEPDSHGLSSDVRVKITVRDEMV